MMTQDSIKKSLAKPAKGAKPSLTAAASKGGVKLDPKKSGNSSAGGFTGK